MIELKSLEDTQNLAEKIAEQVRVGDVIALKGDLGAGKTTFAQFFISCLAGDEIEVLSPTFTLVCPYEFNDFTLYHYDLYRLKSEAEAEDIGIYDAFDDGVCLIEWPEIIDGILPENRLVIDISNRDDVRHVEVIGFGRWERKLLQLGLADE